MLAVYFKNGAVLPIFGTESIFMPAETIETFVLSNACLAVGYSGTSRFAMPQRSFTIVDEADNTWTCELNEARSRMHIVITDPQRSPISDFSINSNYDPSQGWISVLKYVSETAESVTFNVWQMRSSQYVLDSRPYFWGGYIDDFAGTNTYSEAVGIVSSDERYRIVGLTNIITSSDQGKYFADITGLCERASDSAVPDSDYYFGYTFAGSGVYQSEITISKAAVKSLVPDTDPYTNLDGETDIPSDTIPIPGFPPATATSTGIIGLFAPSSAQMQQLADFMWTDFGGQGTSVVEVLEELVEAVKRAISNPLDYVLGLNLIPSQGLSIGAAAEIRFGFVNSGVSMPRLTSQYFAVDCGALSFDALCGDTFLDYAPYAKFAIYLPYIGFREVDANDFVGHTIGVVYHGDVVTGGVTAYITKDGSVMYQYSGCCALNIPLSSDNWGSTIASTVQIATGMIAGGVSAGAAGVGKAAAEGASRVAGNPSLLSPQVAHSGAVSGGAGAMGVQRPFVVREAVRFHSTSNFNTVSGYPAYFYRRLSDMHGYTKVLDVHLQDVPATQGEIDEIEAALKEGVIL